MSEEIGSGSEQHMDEPTPEIVASESAAAPADEPSRWDRRTFFKTAALGTAAVAMYEGGRAVFSPLAAYADDLSNLPCTAQDVRITGPGVIIDEQCVCTGTFTATVAFPVENTTGTERYCVALHLVPNPAVPLTTLDYILINPDTGDSTLPRNTTTMMVATIENYPCGAGRVCFGSEGVTRGKCVPGTCSTVAWNTSPNDADCTAPDQSPPAGQCRHQQICIVGRGDTTLDCDLVLTGIQDTCQLPCAGSATVRLCTGSDASFGPFTFTLSDGQSFGPTTDTCHDFVVGPITSSGTVITGTVTDRTGCARSDSVTFNVTELSATITPSNLGNCAGVVTLTAAVTGGSGCDFTWTDEAGNSLGTGASITYGPVLDGTCHVVTVTADCDGCPATGTISLSQCVTTTVC